MAKAFDGIRVLDFTQVIAGPYSAQLLNMLGADVIKIEPPENGDQFRGLMGAKQPGFETMSPAYMNYNYGKRSLAINLKAADAQKVVWKLIETADVIVENFRAGVIERLGFGYEAVRAVKPDIIYCSVSGYGQTGPEAGKAAYDGAIQATSGMMSMNGHPQTGPTRTSYLPVDVPTGLTAAYSMAAALFRRATTGQGQYIDVAMFDTAISLQASQFARYMTGGEEPELTGNLSPTKAPTGDVFETSDGHIMLAAVNETHGRRLLEALGLADMLEDPRYADNDARLDHSADVSNALQTVFANKPSDHWVTLLEAQNLPVAKVRRVSDVCTDPQLEHRNIMVDIPYAGRPEGIRVTGASFTMSEDGPDLSEPCAELGAHNHEILKELGYDDAAIAVLQLA